MALHGTPDPFRSKGSGVLFVLLGLAGILVSCGAVLWLAELLTRLVLAAVHLGAD